MKKFLSILLVFVLTLGVLSGCKDSSGGDTDTAETKGESATEDDKSAEDTGNTADGEEVTLSVVWFSDGKEGESFQRLANKYHEENPNITIELIEVPYTDMDSKIKNMLNANQAPALARLTTSSFGIFQNQLLDLGEYVSDKDAFIDNFTSSLKFVFEDKVLGAPMDVTANGVIYNKTAFEQAGVSVPQSEDEIWTWEEFKDALQKVMDGSDVKYGLVVDKSPQRFTTFLYEAGASLLNEDLSASNFNTDEAKRAVSYLKELHDDGIIPQSVWVGSENPNELFRTGQIAAHIGGSWMVANYKDEISEFEWGVTYLPKDAKRSSVPGGKYLGAFQGSGVEQEAADFIEWISKPENSETYCLDNYFISPVKGNETLNYEYGSEFYTIFSQELAATGVQPGAEWGYAEFTALVQTDIKEGLESVLAGNQSIEDYLKQIDGVINDALAELK